MNSYDYVSNAVKEYWEKTFPQDVVVFFEQRYTWDNVWSEQNEVVEFTGDYDENSMEFRNDFCEGQDKVRNIHVVSLDVVLDHFRKNMEFLEYNDVESW